MGEMRTLATILGAMLSTVALAAEQPAQPKSGPGGSDYPHKSVVRNVYGTGVQQFWLFEPAEPKPEKAPVVVFVHGWMGIEPAIYLGWIQHLARRGNIVVYPRYQTGPMTAPWTFTDNAIAAVKLALAELKAPGHVAPDTERFAIAGHSAGGAITADMAARAADAGLPKPRAVMVVQPGRGIAQARSPFFPPADYRKIPADACLLVLVGDRDRVVGDASARDIFGGVPQIPADHKDYIIVQSDSHGEPPLVADHLSPCCPLSLPLFFTGRRINALDYYAYWKLLDALLDYAFEGKHKAYCLGDTPEQRFMGKWSDGTPVKELLVKKEP